MALAPQQRAAHRLVIELEDNGVLVVGVGHAALVREPALERDECGCGRLREGRAGQEECGGEVGEEGFHRS